MTCTKLGSTGVQEQRPPDWCCPWVFVLSYIPPIMGPLNACHVVDTEVNHKHGDFPGGPGLRLHALNAEGPATIPGQGTRSHVSQPNNLTYHS